MDKNSTFPIAAGTFIQYDMTVGWGDNEWLSELKYLKEAGMSYLILGTDENIKESIIELALKNGLSMGFKVFITINYNNKWFEKGTDENWFKAQMSVDSKVAVKIYNKYYEKYKESFYGWYFPYEVDNMNFNSRKKFAILANGLNLILRNIKEGGARLPIMISPFMNSYYGTPMEYAENWAYLFANTDFDKGDIFCPQDCVGGGGLNISDVDKWFKAFKYAVDKKPGLLFWANAETFDHTNWCSAPLKRFINQMKIESKYVDNIITFSYSHYYSPNNIDPRLHRIYLKYVKTGALPESKPRPPKDITVKSAGISKVKICWEPGQSNLGVFGYELYRNGKVIYKTYIERKYGGTSKGIVMCYEDREVYKLGVGCLKPLVYEVKTIDMAGNSS